MLLIPARTTDYSKLNDTRNSSTTKLSSTEVTPRKEDTDTMNYNETTRDTEFNQNKGNVYFGI